MNRFSLRILSGISLIILAFLLLYYFIPAATTKVWEGDSIGYHIPISQLILTGKIVNPALGVFPPVVDRGMIFCPGSTEIILSIFALLHIPLNLFDFFGIIILFFVMKALARSYDFSEDYSIIFATSIACLHTVMRWILSQTIDMWLASFFALSIILLRSPKNTYKYFISLGIALGMLFGSKYTGPAFIVFLLVVFGKNILKNINLKRFITFLLPFSILGLSWYIRNYFLKGDPYYPQSIIFFKGIEWHILDYPVWKVIFEWAGGFWVWINAFISEYTVWCLSFLAVPILYFSTYKHLNKNLRIQILKLIALGYACFLIYLFLPSGYYPNLVTSGFRYTYPAMIPLILCVFIFAKKFAKEEILSIIAVTNILIMPELSYHPKVLIALIPVALAIIYPSKIKKFYESIKKGYAHISAKF